MGIFLVLARDSDTEALIFSFEGVSEALSGVKNVSPQHVEGECKHPQSEPWSRVLVNTVYFNSGPKTSQSNQSDH